MSLYSAMRSGVSGMSAQSSRLAAISDNISNSQTVGYKRATVDFSTLLTSPGSSVYSAGGVQSSTRYQLGQDGTPIGTSSATDMAISGSGFFVVGNNSSGSPQYSLTRAGSFLPDDSGYLRNTAGQYLEAWKLAPDGSLPNVSTTRFDDLVPVNVGNLLYGGSSTTQMEFSGNLPAQATVGTTFSTTTSFYDGLGNPHDITVNWKKAVDGVPGIPGTPGDPTAVPPIPAVPDIPPVPAQWEVSIAIPSAGYSSSAPQTVHMAINGPYAGKPVDPVTGDLAAMPSFIVTSPALPTPDTFTVGFGNVTQLNGDYVPQITSDGSKVGRVTTMNIDETGKLWAIYDNGARQALYQIPIADVVNPDGLVAQNGNTFTLGMNAGPLTLSKGNSAGAGSVIGGALEQSNVDIATELVSLIETQRAYSSNATIVRTADEMVDETNRLKR